MNRRCWQTPLVLLLAATWISCFPGGLRADQWPADIEKVLVEAGSNRAQLENVLLHFHRTDDLQAYEAACFLVRNMPGHSYVITALFDRNKKEIPFDVLSFKNFGAASEAMDLLEKEHGALDFARKTVLKDVECVTAEYLIENIRLAMQQWREVPWAKSMSFDTFCEYILPYRCSNEPVEAWRKACIVETAKVIAQVSDRTSPHAVAGAVQKLAGKHVGFRSLYYLHPTDQGFAEMCDRGQGRCEDMTNMRNYVLRANCIASASDYTPHWANRDNNHAWDVVLDQNGQGRGGLSNRAAKVYRKMFSHNLQNLYFQNADDQELPKWLSGRSYLDVTDQYMETADVAVTLVEPPAKETKFAYICVFNGGEWKPIHWGSIQNDQVTFCDMGRSIAYLPAYYVDSEIVPAAPPFILDATGGVQTLAVKPGNLKQIQIRGISPAIEDADLKKKLPGEKVQKGKSYQWFVWDKGWKSLGEQIANDRDQALLGELPAGGLYWIVSKTNRQKARIFTVEDGKQQFW